MKRPGPGRAEIDPRGSGTYASGMVSVKAKVRAGRLVLDEPVDLPEGTEVELVPVPSDEFDAEHEGALQEALARSAEQIARGETLDGEEVLDRLGPTRS